MLEELPLTIFTTLAPIGAGGFVGLALVVLMSALDDECLKKLFRLLFIPFGVVVVAFLAAFFHLTNPLNALWVISGIGTSPMSNEIVAGVAFAGVAGVTALLGALGKLTGVAAKVLLVISAVLAVVFSWLIGTAYAVPTVATWSAGILPIVALGYSVLGGALFASLITGVEGLRSQSQPATLKYTLLALVIIGAIATIAGSWIWFNEVGTVVTPFVNGEALKGSHDSMMIAFAVLVLASAVIGVIAVLRNRGIVLPIAALVLLVAGVFLLRVVFYALKISVGL